jgi:hypothetical protein
MIYLSTKKMVPGWRVDIETQATVLRWYEPLVVPGLARQAIWTERVGPKLWCILDEGVLHRAIGGSKVMRSQLYRLAEVAEHPKTTIQVIRSGGAHAGLLAEERWS